MDRDASRPAEESFCRADVCDVLHSLVTDQEENQQENQDGNWAENQEENQEEDQEGHQEGD